MKLSTSDGITRNGLINVGGLVSDGTWRYSVDNGVSWQSGTGSSLQISRDGATTVQLLQADAAGSGAADAAKVGPGCAIDRQ